MGSFSSRSWGSPGLFIWSHGSTERRADSVAHGRVTVCAGEFFGLGACREHRFVDLGVAASAIVLQDLTPAGGDFDGFLEGLESKQLAVSPAVFGFGQVLGHELVREVTFHTDGCRVVA